MIKACTGKNFIIYCEQSVSNAYNHETSRKEEAIFFLSGVKVINGTLIDNSDD